MTKRKVGNEDSESDERLEASLAEHDAKMRHWHSLSFAEQVALLNEAYADFPDEEEKAWLEFGRRQAAKFLADDKW